jgi:DNA-binding IclR family transcriptional regulator
VLAEAKAALSLSTIARQIGLPVGTTHRILTTLVTNGYVERDLRTKWYELGMKVLEPRGPMTNGAIRMAAEIRPHLRSLSRRTRVRVHLALYRGGNIVYIDRVDPRDESAYVPLGFQAPAHATSLGKAILAFAPADEVAAYIAARLGQRFTSSTIVDGKHLRTELTAIRDGATRLTMASSSSACRVSALPCSTTAQVDAKLADPLVDVVVTS